MFKKIKNGFLVFQDKIETGKTIENMNKTKCWFFVKIKCIDNALASLTPKKREKTQINKIVNERGGITTDTIEIQRIILI